MAPTIEQAGGIPGNTTAHKGSPQGRLGQVIDKSVEVTNRRKSSVRAKVESVFGVIKRVFGFQKVCYRRLAKNLHRLERMGFSWAESVSVFQIFLSVEFQ